MLTLPFFLWRTSNIQASDVVPVRIAEIRDTILALCQERGDDWARILHIHDMHAADAVYHRVCSANFHAMKSRYPQLMTTKIASSLKK